MPSPRIRMSRFRTDERPVSARIPPPASRISTAKNSSNTNAACNSSGSTTRNAPSSMSEAALRRSSNLDHLCAAAERRAGREPLPAQDRRADRPLGLVGSHEIPLTVSLATLRADLGHIVAAAIAGGRCRRARRPGACPRHPRRDACAPDRTCSPSGKRLCPWHARSPPRFPVPTSPRPDRDVRRR